ncbi:MAG: hypothetical protein MZU84_04140 [Sphingobacterium sp.]|nr:hypothetical protein [Sphingobacterium sp.]
MAAKAADCDENTALRGVHDGAVRRRGRAAPAGSRRRRRRAGPRRRAALMPAWFSLNDLHYLLPELVLAGGALVLLVATALDAEGPPGLAVVARHRRPRRASAVAMIAVTPGAPVSVARGLLVDRRVQHVLQGHLPAVGGPHAAAVDALPRHARAPGTASYVFLVLCATLGMMFMATGTDLITIFIGLETMAIVVLHPGRAAQARPAVERGRR